MVNENDDKINPITMTDNNITNNLINTSNENDILIDNNNTEANNKSTKELLKNIPWPFEASELYKIAIRFYKDNVDKAFHPSYEQKNSLIAYRLQERYGKFNIDKAAPLGAFDFVGHDRRNAWISLEDMTPSIAQKNFIDQLDSLCPLFRPYVMAIKCDLDEKKRRQQELEEAEQRKQKELEEYEQRKLEEEAQRKEEERIKKYKEQKRLIKEILNRQTLNQFSSYARQQYPDSIDLQESLISQLQEQHFQQYMQQMMEHSNDTFGLNGDGVFIDNEQIEDYVQQQYNKNNNNLNNELALTNEGDNNLNQIEQNGGGGGNGHLIDDDDDDDDEDDEEEDEDENGFPVKEIANASMWTRKDIVTFKESIMAEGSDGILKVGHGEIATIRVPTHQDGNCIFWEFATDHYDIGFGLLFEWMSNPDNQVSIHISESDDEEDEDFPSNGPNANDIESGSSLNNTNELKKNGTNTPVSIIIPIYRRDCHEEVFAGNHVYPGKGVYHLKFDNSYSLWRSKTLYYRVYYTKET